MNRNDIHSCGYFCTRPACIKAQRDELRDRMERRIAEAVAAEREKHEHLRHAIREAMYMLDQPEPRVHAAYGELSKALNARCEK